MTHRVLVFAGLALAAGGACAATSGVSTAGFLVTHRLEVKATPHQVFDAFGQVSRWWNSEHTFSGKASNLSLGMNAGDCFCERWDGGSVEHAHVIYVGRDAVLRLRGSFGPLQDLGVVGVLTLATAAVDGKTVFKLSYRISGGGPDSGLEKLAPAVDGMMGEQAQRLVRFIETGAP